MAEQDTASKATEKAAVAAPKPAAAPEPSVAEKARTDIAKAKTGFDPTRPFRYIHAFVKGTLHHGLNGIAKWGQKGMKWGAIAGFAAWMAPATAALFGTSISVGGTLGGMLAIASGGTIPALIAGVAVFAGAAFVAGMVIGGAKGFLTGGMREVGRLHRSEVYAEDLVQRSKIQQNAPSNRADYRAARRAQAQRDANNAQWFLVRENEAERDNKTYWQDQVQGQSHSLGNGKSW